ncbi:MAG: hypothetical protein GEV06_23400 [Luteitalea sp.]|nr:hypothetical protein [Luteitalea sp.]
MVEDDSLSGARRESPEGRSIRVASMVESIVGCKWSIHLLQLCAEGHRRPSVFLRACPGLSAKVMHERLRKMTAFGIVQRTVVGEKPPVEVEYQLTPFGLRFMRILKEVRRLQDAVDQGAVSKTGGPDAEPKRRRLMTRQKARSEGWQQPMFATGAEGARRAASPPGVLDRGIEATLTKPAAPLARRRED